MKEQFFRHTIGDALAAAGFTCPDGYFVELTPLTEWRPWEWAYTTSILIKEAGATDMFSHPHIGLAADEAVEETRPFREFIERLLQIKAAASPKLRWYILQLVYDDGFRRRFLQYPEEELALARLDEEDKQALRQVLDRLEAEVAAFRPGKVIDDGDHFLLFPQTVERIAPQAWFSAAWPYIARFRSNFGLYLGEALLYPRVTILGTTGGNPAVTEQEQAALKRKADRQVERIAISNADDLRRVLDWGVEHGVRFGLGDQVTYMILEARPDAEIVAAIQARFAPADMDRMMR